MAREDDGLQEREAEGNKSMLPSACGSSPAALGPRAGSQGWVPRGRYQARFGQAALSLH